MYLGKHSSPETTAHTGVPQGAIDDICLTADGVVPLDLEHLSSREALLGPAGAAYRLSGIVVATDGSLKKSGAMGAAFVAKDNRLQARSVAVYGPPSSIRPELTGMALALEDCPRETDLNILTDSLSAMQLLKSMQRRDFPLWLYRHTARQLLLQVVQLLNDRAAKGAVTRLVKVRAHRAEPLNEAADALAAEAAELDPSLPVTIELDPEAVHFQLKGSWMEWDARLRRELSQRAAALRVKHLLRPEAKAMPQTASASWPRPGDPGKGAGGDASLHCKKANPPVHCQRISWKCSPFQVGGGSFCCMQTMWPSCRDAGAHSVLLPRSQRGSN